LRQLLQQPPEFAIPGLSCPHHSGVCQWTENAAVAAELHYPPGFYCVHCGGIVYHRGACWFGTRCDQERQRQIGDDRVERAVRLTLGRGSQRSNAFWEQSRVGGKDRLESIHGEPHLAGRSGCVLIAARRFKLSNDPLLVDKVRDIVGCT